MSRAAATEAHHPAEVALGFLLMSVSGATLLAGATVQTAGLIFHGRWLHIPLQETANALLALPRHLGDPAAAWPSAIRADIPSTVELALSAVIVLALLVVVLMAVVAVVDAYKPPRPGSARWARTRDLRPLLARRPQPGRVTLGQRRRRLICGEPLHSTLVIGPTQSGKTSGLAIPAILEWQGPVVATSVKTDLLRSTVKAREQVGTVRLFDPAGSTNRASDGWTPLAGCESWTTARRTAAWLANGSPAAPKGLGDGDFWSAAAAKLIAPLLFAAANTNGTMADVIHWIDTQEVYDVKKALMATAEPAAIDAFAASEARDPRQGSSIYTTAETILEAYADPSVLLRSQRNDINVHDLLDGGTHTLYLSATVREQQRLRPLFVALLESVIEAAFARSATTGEPLSPPLLVVLDEAANIAPRPDLDVVASTAASHGVQLITVLQDLAQAHDRWGRDRADTIVNNHRARVVAGGTADERTLDYVARLLGDTEVRQESATHGDQGHRTTTRSTSFRQLAPGHQLRQARPGSALLLYGNLPPAWIRFRPWFQTRRLRLPIRRKDAASLVQGRDERIPSVAPAKFALKRGAQLLKLRGERYARSRSRDGNDVDVRE